MKEWLSNLDTTKFEENLERIGFNKHHINMIKARVDTYILPQLPSEITDEKLKHIKGCVDRIWSDCFDAPIPFSVAQLDIINSAITQAKLDIERLNNVGR